MSLTFTKISETKLTGGLVTKRYSVLLDNAYPVAGYDLSDPTKFGLTMYQLKSSQTGFVDPIVHNTNNSKVLAEVVGLKLLLSYPTGGSIASPTTPAAPATSTIVVTTTPDAGATTMTGSAAKPALVGVNTGGLTPGLGKAFPDVADASTITCVISATGYSS